MRLASHRLRAPASPHPLETCPTARRPGAALVLAPGHAEPPARWRCHLALTDGVERRLAVWLSATAAATELTRVRIGPSDRLDDRFAH